MNNLWKDLPNSKYLDLLLDSVNDKDTWTYIFNTLPEYIDDQSILVSWRIAAGKLHELNRKEIFSRFREEIEKRFRSGNPSGKMIVVDAALALISYDDHGYLFDSDPSEVKMLAKLGVVPADLLWGATRVIQEIKNSHE